MPTPTTPARGYQMPSAGNKLNQDIERLTAALLAIDIDIAAILAAAVTVSGSQTVYGAKTFSSSPVVPTAAPGDNTGKAASTAFVRAAIAAILDSAPGTLDTLNELAAALGDDPNFAATIAAQIATKADDAATTAALAGKASSSHTHAVSDITGAPAFSAYLTSTQTVSNGVATKISLGSETFDTNNAFDTSTYRFQPAVAGYYFFTGKVAGVAATSATSCVAFIYKNGAAVKQGTSYVAPSGQGMSAGVSGLVYLNGSTDYVELWATNSGSGTNTFTAGATLSYFDGHFVRP